MHYLFRKFFKELNFERFLFVSVGLWTLFFVFSRTGLSIHFDMAEAYAWGNDFQLAHEKHPPMSGWLAGMWFSMFAATEENFYLLSAFCILVSLACNFMLIRSISGTLQAGLACSMLLITPLLSFLASRYNANSPLLFLIPLSVLLLGRAITTQSRIGAVSAGFAAAFCVLTKYSAIPMLAGIILAFAMCKPSARSWLWSNRAVYCAGAFLFMLSPHVIGLYQEDFITFTHIGSVRMNVQDVALRVVTVPFEVLLYCTLPFIYVIAFFPNRRQRLLNVVNVRSWTQERRFLFALFGCATLSMMLAALVAQAKLVSPWMAPVVALLIAFMLADPGLSIRSTDFRRGLATTVFFSAIMAIVSPIIGRVERTNSRGELNVPMRDAVSEAVAIWTAEVGRPLEVVSGDEMANMVSFYAPSHPRAVVRPRQHAWFLGANAILVVCRIESCQINLPPGLTPPVLRPLTVSSSAGILPKDLTIHVGIAVRNP